MFSIVRNLALNVQEKRKREQPGLVEEILEAQESGQAFLELEGDPDIKEALNTLEEKERTIIVLRFFEEKKLSEIAEIMNENVSTVKSKLYRALQKLKVELGDMAYFAG